jgi:DNA-binding CsgD family transcriptional regulator
MDVIEELVRAREAYERRAWLAAYDSLSAAGPQGADDFDRLGTAAFLLERTNDCVQAYQRAYQAHLDAGDPMAAVRSGFYIAMALFTHGEPAIGGGWVSRCAQLLDQRGEDVVERGYLLVHLMYRHIESQQFAEALEVSVDIAAYGRRFGDPDLLAIGLSSQGRLLTRSGRVSDGLALLDEAMLGLASGEVSPIVAGQAYCAMIEACQDLSDFGRAAEWTSALSRWCDDQPELVAFTGQCAVHRGQIMRFRGAYGPALEELDRAIHRYVAVGSQQAVGLAYYERAEVLRLRGDYAEADTGYAAATAGGFDPQPGLALLWLARGREPTALAAVQRLLAEPRDPVGRAAIIPAAVEVLLAVELLEPVEPLASELRATAVAVGCDALHASAAVVTGRHLLARGDAADALGELRRAAQLWSALSAPYEVARCRVLVGHALLALGDEESAAGELQQAGAAFAELGAAPAAAAAARVLQPESPGGLTPRELEVLRLVAAGKTNPEIATALVLSEKTVARHLSNIFVKLGVNTRTAAASYAYEHRIV